MVDCLRASEIQIATDIMAVAAFIPDGITVVGPENPEDNKIAEAFKTAGFVLNVIQGPIPQGLNAKISVGLKPPSF